MLKETEYNRVMKAKFLADRHNLYLSANEKEIYCHITKEKDERIISPSISEQHYQYNLYLKHDELTMDPIHSTNSLDEMEGFLHGWKRALFFQRSLKNPEALHEFLA